MASLIVDAVAKHRVRQPLEAVAGRQSTIA
jgi:hypothetical protein